jgi:hypothetical protein
MRRHAAGLGDIMINGSRCPRLLRNGCDNRSRKLIDPGDGASHIILTCPHFRDGIPDNWQNPQIRIKLEYLNGFPQRRTLVYGNQTSDMACAGHSPRDQ